MLIKKWSNSPARADGQKKQQQKKTLFHRAPSHPDTPYPREAHGRPQCRTPIREENGTLTSHITIIPLPGSELSRTPDTSGMIGFLTIERINAQFLQSNFNEVTLQVSERNIDILCVSETWLLPHTPDEYVNIPNYKIFRCDGGQVQEHVYM